MWKPRGDTALLYEFLPGDRSSQTHSFAQALSVLAQYRDGGTELRLLDLGCGTGDSFERFRKAADLSWIGVDIAESQEVNKRIPRGYPICTYDGVHIPIKTESIDLVYSHQVFEHVRHPEPLLAEILRVLKTSGWFVGSTSHLEPFHSRSYWNFTPFGFCSLLKTAGFTKIVIRPGIDAPSLIMRRLFAPLKGARLFNTFFTHESPLNLTFESLLHLARVDVKRRNAIKLLFAGQFCFVAAKNGASNRTAPSAGRV